MGTSYLSNKPPVSLTDSGFLAALLAILSRKKEQVRFGSSRSKACLKRSDPDSKVLSLR